MEELTPELNYRLTVIEAIDFLKQTKEEVYVKMVNIAMAGELDDGGLVFKEGDEINLTLEDLKRLEDDNVHALLRQDHILDETISYLIERNDIEEDELGIKVE